MSTHNAKNLWNCQVGTTNRTATTETTEISSIAPATARSTRASSVLGTWSDAEWISFRDGFSSPKMENIWVSGNFIDFEEKLHRSRCTSFLYVSNEIYLLESCVWGLVIKTRWVRKIFRKFIKQDMLQSDILFFFLKSEISRYCLFVWLTIFHYKFSNLSTCDVRFPLLLSRMSKFAVLFFNWL